MPKTSEAKRAYQRDYYARNREAIRERRRAYMAEYREKNRERVRRLGRESRNRRWHLMAYGLTDEQYRAMVEAQGGLCAICGQPETAIRRGAVKPLAVDHDHETRKVRALLCHNCNAALGLMRDDPTRLRAAADYLLFAGADDR